MLALPEEITKKTGGVKKSCDGDRPASRGYRGLNMG